MVLLPTINWDHLLFAYDLELNSIHQYLFSIVLLIKTLLHVQSTCSSSTPVFLQVCKLSGFNITNWMRNKQKTSELLSAGGHYILQKQIKGDFWHLKYILILVFTAWNIQLSDITAYLTISQIDKINTQTHMHGKKRKKS